MKPVAVALVAAAVSLAGCAGAGHPKSPSSPSSSPRVTTYTSSAFRFAVTYDSGLLTGAPDRSDVAGIGQMTLPGLGQLPKARTLLYVLRPRTAASALEARLTVLQVMAFQPSVRVPRPTLATFSNEPYMESLTKRNAYPYRVSTPQAATIGGLPAFHFFSPPKGRHVIETYTVVDGRSIYTLNLVLPAGTPADIASALRAALQSFRTTS